MSTPTHHRTHAQIERGERFLADQAPHPTRGPLLSRADVKYLDALPARLDGFRRAEAARRGRLMAPVTRGFWEALGLARAA